jgi:hypothetical protein
MANISRRMEVGGLSGIEFPRTIRDAMTLVDDRGERYLWVDAVCIIQDDPVDQGGQIGVMNTIYGASWLTIVAAAGYDAHVGLPRARHDPEARELRQHLETVQGLRLMVPLYVLPRRNSRQNEMGYPGVDVSGADAAMSTPVLHGGACETRATLRVSTLSSIQWWSSFPSKICVSCRREMALRVVLYRLLAPNRFKKLMDLHIFQHSRPWLCGFQQCCPPLFGTSHRCCSNPL